MEAPVNLKGSGDTEGEGFGNQCDLGRTAVLVAKAGMQNKWALTVLVEAVTVRSEPV